MSTSNLKKYQYGQFSKSTKKSLGPTASTKKVTRNLKQQFDQYVLKQQSLQDSNKINYKGIESSDNQNQLYQFTQSATKGNQSHSKFHRNSSLKKIGTENINNSKSQIKHRQKFRNSESAQNSVMVPKSYILAMEHLQGLVENKNQQVVSLKHQLLQKQQIILQCQEKINEVLLKYHQLMDMYTLKEHQVIILKQQMQQLKLDKNTALKQAAKAIQPVFKLNQHQQPPQMKPIPSQQNFITFKHRSISVQSPYLPTKHAYDPLPPTNFQQFQPSHQTLQSRELKNYYNQQNFNEQYRKNQAFIEKQKINKQNNMRRSQQTQKSVKMTQRQMEKNHQNVLLKNYVQPSSASSRMPLLSYKSTNRDFISYQRQILRNQKQLIALKYRMQCLQRKLSVDPKQQSVKQKIRKLSTQIDSKQRMINDLKKL